MYEVIKTVEMESDPVGGAFYRTGRGTDRVAVGYHDEHLLYLGYHTGTAGCGIFDRLSEKRCDRYYIPVRSGDRTEPDPGRCAGVYQSGQANGPGAGGAGISDHHQRYLETAKFRRPSAAGHVAFALAIINIVFGVVLLINPFAKEILITLVGIGFVYSGATDLYVTISISRKLAHVEEEYGEELQNIK